MKKRSLKTCLTVLAFFLSFAMLFAILPIQSAADGNDGMPAETLPNPDYDPDADPTVTDPPTLEPIGNAGGGDADPMIIDPGIGGGGGIPLGPENTPLASGVYTIVNAANQKAVDVRAGGTTAGTVVQQYTDYGSTVNRNQLFKVTYLTSVNGFHYYTIRSMTNSALGLTVDASGVVLDDIGTSDQYANVASNDRWVITVYDTGIYSIQTTSNLGGYLTTGGSTANEYQLDTATTTSTNTRWTFREYEGEAIEGYGWHSAPTEVIPGESVTYSAYMYSTVSHRNGPVTYSLYMDGDTVDDYATIDASTGVLTATNGENIQVRVLPYANAPWVGYKNVEILFNNQIVYTFTNTYNEYLIQPSDADPNTTLSGIAYNVNATSCLWKIIHVENGYFKIQNDVTGYYMRAPGNNQCASGILHAGLDTTYGLWKISKSDDGYYILQSKNQYDRMATNPLYLSISNGNITQEYLSTRCKWEIKPLKLNLNVIYDQAFVDRFGEDEYMDILKNIYAKSSTGEATLSQVFKERYGILVTVTYASNVYESFPYTQNCIHKNNIDTACEDCKNEGSGGADPAGDCEDGYHHKSIVKMLEALPHTFLYQSTYTTILHTGHVICSCNEDQSSDIITVLGVTQNNINAVVINNSYYASDLMNGSYQKTRYAVFHELLHTFKLEHCNDDSNYCIMHAAISGNINDLTLLPTCDICNSTLQVNKMLVYYHN